MIAIVQIFPFFGSVKEVNIIVIFEYRNMRHEHEISGTRKIWRLTRIERGRKDDFG